eukprot:TRINITY_DN47510_c0_g1_i1.p1 TRINITY_DN47510_c0_g1~~TRINITY_DN47510_c0_g1_i1.p1  ORF type:complete len:171 (+),score=15.36 TRINITY_DN47510_c0_g1_i1:151-663(+)
MLGGRLKLKGAGDKKTGTKRKREDDSSVRRPSRAQVLAELAELETEVMDPDEKRIRVAQLKAKLGADVEVQGWTDAQSFRSDAKRAAVQKQLLEMRQAEAEDAPELTDRDLSGHKRLLKLKQQGKDVDPISVYGDINGGRRGSQGRGASEYEKQLDRRCKLKSDKWCNAL